MNITNTIASKAVIAVLNMGRWEPVKAHRDESAAENARHGLHDEVTVLVRLTKHASLTKLAACHSQARMAHYGLTLPGMDKGLRLLPGSKQFAHSDTLRAFAAQHDSLVDDFAAAYESERATAPDRLKALYDERHWPSVDRVREQFKFSVRYLPVPHMGPWEEWFAESLSVGMADLRERVGDALRRIAVTLKDPKKIFRDSLVENLREVVATLPDLNLANDPAITTLAAQAHELAKVEPDLLRVNPEVREAAAQRAADLCDMFKL